MHLRDQTIFALSSGRPPTAIAIVRDFFASNLTVMTKDAELIFGRETLTS